MENGRPREYMENYDECEFRPCNMLDPETEIPGNAQKKCEYYGWSKWSDWGPCNKKCGQEGKRERKRKCVNACDNDKETTENVRERCPPFKNDIVKKEYTDTDTTVCSPCPIEETSQWSEWGEWRVEKGPQCGPGKRIETRSRACVAGKDRTKKCPGNDKQTKEFQLSPCPNLEGGSYKADGYDGDGGDDGNEGEGDGGEGMYPGADDGDGDGGQDEGDDGGAGDNEGYGNDTDGEGDGEDGMNPGGDNNEGDGDGNMYPGGGQEEDMEEKYPGEEPPEAGQDYFDEYDTREEDDISE